MAEKVEKKAYKKSKIWRWEDQPEGIQLQEKAKAISQRFDRPSMEQFFYIFGLWWSLRKEWRKNSEQKMEPSLNHFLDNGRAGAGLKIASWQWLTPNMARRLIDILKARAGQKNIPCLKNKKLS